MRQKLSVLIVLLIFLFVPAAQAAAVQVIINDERHLEPETIVRESTTLVPLRDIFEALDATVDWDANTETITATRDESTIILRVESRKADLNGTELELAQPARIINNVTYVPLRFVSESLGAQVDWNSNTGVIRIDLPAEKPKPSAANRGGDEDAGKLSVPSSVWMPDGAIIERDYTWEYDSKKFKQTFEIPTDLWETYSKRERLQSNNLAHYVTDLGDDDLLTLIASELATFAQGKGYSDREIIEFVTSFVQHFEYIADEESKDQAQYTRYPVETLVEKRGDCEDTSILLASLLRALGLECVLLIFPEDPGHVAVGVNSNELTGIYYPYKNARYYYIETTSKDWKPGQVSEDYRGRNAHIQPLVPQAIIKHKTEIETISRRITDVTVTVFNTGSAPRNAAMYVALDAGGNKVYDQKLSAPFTLKPGDEKTLSFRLIGPPKHEPIVKVKIVDDNTILDESRFGGGNTDEASNKEDQDGKDKKDKNTA